MRILNDLKDSFLRHKDRNAFFINKTAYTYSQLTSVVSGLRSAIREKTGPGEKNTGLVINDDLETYASIIALWLEGKAYVPVNPENPVERNNKIIAQADIRTIIDSSEKTLFSGFNLIVPGLLQEKETDLDPVSVPESDIAYLFFTSGTTGEPKGVPVSRSNVASFIEAFDDMGLEIDENDRILQMFELTFDLSVMSYLVPLLHGSCVYTIPKNKIKYNYIYELMEEQNLTVSLMVPSILHYLRPYFDEIDFPQMRYSLFCGEALNLDVTEEWSRCLPNAEIFNVYGPTENTIFCTTYKFNRNAPNKEINGILSIGKAMKNVITAIVDDNNNLLPPEEKGELCLAGALLTPGYWKNEAKNKEAFFITPYNGVPTRFYKTGDLCKTDHEGDIYYLGRIDFQTKIQGFRVELSEVEFHSKLLLEKTNLAAIAYENSIGNTEIGLAIEGREFDTREFVNNLKLKLPSYMIPTKFLFMNAFPLNTNGKTDRKVLKGKFENN